MSEDNTSIKISEQEFIEVRADYRQTNAVYLPNITASHTGIATTKPLISNDKKHVQNASVFFNERRSLRGLHSNG